MEIQHVAVLGAGQMGSGIAQVLAVHGVDVVLFDPKPGACEAALARMHTALSKDFERGKLATHPPEILGRIRAASRVEEAKGADLAIEAVVESETVKRTLFADLDRVLGAQAILASNTSSIPITRLGASTTRPGQVVGMHFMNPVPIMALVELIPGLETTAETLQAVQVLAERLGKQTIVSRDRPGFVVNRILMPMINEAFFALEEGLATAEDIDRGMKLGTNQPMGPLTLADFIGLDTCLSILDVLHRGLGDDKYRPSPLLRSHVDAGWLGRKVKRGVFRY